MISVRSNHISLKYQRFTLSGCKDIGIRKFKFVAKPQFLSFTKNKFSQKNPSFSFTILYAETLDLLSNG